MIVLSSKVKIYPVDTVLFKIFMLAKSMLVDCTPPRLFGLYCKWTAGLMFCVLLFEEGRGKGKLEEVLVKEVGIFDGIRFGR